jgi:UDP-N-acetylglucosamine 2-epimerase (non-hydrolysing)/GDP/UDP-N,N'-diacetylbacillosamine 2-epimerase (hydrolysing)
MAKTRTICFVTGTRAEFGLMENTLRAIEAERGLRLQIVATGMHLDATSGRTVDDIRWEGWRVNATVPWRAAKADLTLLARETGRATSLLASLFGRLDPDVVLVVGDRVEAFAGATAGHLSGRVVAHVHGGDRALGQVDDALRHAITKLAHVHFPATAGAAERIERLGEDRWRIHPVGSPGIDGIVADAWSAARVREHLTRENSRALLSTGGVFDSATLRPRGYALLLLHPTEADDAVEARRAQMLLTTTLSVGVEHVVTVYPNNDPGSAGIVECWGALQHRRYRATPRALARRVFVRNLPRGAFLGLLRDAAVLVGNSSSGIIEAGSFGTPVIDVGPRQAGRERGENVTTVPFRQAAVRAALAAVWNGGRPRRYPRKNPYGRGDTARRIARVLATMALSPRLRRKLIAY